MSALKEVEIALESERKRQREAWVEIE